MAKKTEVIKPEETNEAVEEIQNEPIDSKYRMIIIAAQRSKQLQRGARPRIDNETLKHKNTRVAVMEVMQGKVGFEIIKKKV